MTTTTHPNRGRAQTVTMRRSTYAAVLIEGAAIASIALEAAERIQTAAACGAPQFVVNDAGKLGVRATAALKQFRAWAEGLES